MLEIFWTKFWFWIFKLIRIRNHSCISLELFLNISQIWNSTMKLVYRQNLGNIKIIFNMSKIVTLHGLQLRSSSSRNNRKGYRKWNGTNWKSNRYFIRSNIYKVKLPWCRDTGNDFFVPQISGGSVTFPGTRNVR